MRIAAEFVSARSTTIGVKRVRNWAKARPRGAAVVDLGCGPGFPITEVLVAEGLRVYGVDAAPSFVQAFRRNLPNTPIACEAVQDSKFFDRTFDGVLAWGLMFLLSPEDQRRLIQRIADILTKGVAASFATALIKLRNGRTPYVTMARAAGGHALDAMEWYGGVPGGGLLFTSPAEIGFGNDVMTGLETRSLGAEEYRRRLSAVGLSVASEYEDEGRNHYFDVSKE